MRAMRSGQTDHRAAHGVSREEPGAPLDVSPQRTPQAVCLDDAELLTELLRMTDAHTHELFPPTSAWRGGSCGVSDQPIDLRCRALFHQIVTRGWSLGDGCPLYQSRRARSFERRWVECSKRQSRGVKSGLRRNAWPCLPSRAFPAFRTALIRCAAGSRSIFRRVRHTTRCSTVGSWPRFMSS